MPSPSSTTTTAVSPTPTTPDLASFPTASCCVGQSVEPGRYRLPLSPALSVELGAEWRVIREPNASLFALVQGTNVVGGAGRWLYFFVLPPTMTADALLGQIESMPEVVIGGTRAPVSVAGFAGLQVDALAAPNPDFAGSAAGGIPPGTQHLPAIEELVATGFSITTASPEAVLRFITLDVSDRTLLVLAEAPTSEFDAFAVEADAVLDTLQTVLD